jgi:hypothetical protein
LSDKEKLEKKLMQEFTAANMMDTPVGLPETQKIQGQDLRVEYRWIDAKKFQESGNMHKNNWQVYVAGRDKEAPSSKWDYGYSSDGTIRRGTVILAYRPKVVGEAHRMKLKERAALFSGKKKKRAQELREQMRDEDIDSTVSEGYDD